MANKQSFDIIIAGGGLSGLTLAKALCNGGLNVALVAPLSAQPDGRSTALLAHSVDYLESLSVWQEARHYAAPMAAMRLIDCTRRLIHAPESLFKSAEIGLPAFGYNILNAHLAACLNKSLNGDASYHRINDKVLSICETDQVEVNLAGGNVISAKAIVGADGRGSLVRGLAGKQGRERITTSQWQYPQSAIVLNFEHTLPHHDASTEFHWPEGPFTIVPLTTKTSSLVWVVRPEKCAEILALNPDVLNRKIEKHMHSVLGKITIASTVQSFPLGGMRASKMALGRVFLVGDAAHGLPPIGAQGYNLGIRDIETLAELLVQKSSAIDAIARQYHRARAGDVTSRTIGVDLFNRSLLSSFLPTQFMRAGGIMALNQIGPMRKIMMREGIAPGLGFSEIRKNMRELAEGLRPQVKDNG